MTGLSFEDAVVSGGGKLESVHLEGTWFAGRNEHGRAFSARDFVGAHFKGIMSDGSKREVRIDDIDEAPLGTYWDTNDSDIHTYVVSFDSGDGWLPMCGRDSTGSPVRSFPLAGTWDYTSGTPTGGSHSDDGSRFTFACEGYVLAKCAEAGYKPWLSQETARYHQTCTRMMRADYCGDGTPHTKVGTLINIYDNIGIQKDTVDWPFEAEWTTHGAACMVRPRWADLPLPTCAAQLKKATCGAPSDFGKDGVLIMNEDGPQ